jgi:hypothetical protein
MVIPLPDHPAGFKFLAFRGEERHNILYLYILYA